MLNDNSKEAIAKNVDDLLSKMTLDEKIGQMTQVDYAAFQDFNDINKYFIGSVLWGGGSEIDDLSASGWAKVADSIMTFSLKTRLGIPLILGIDAVHGHNNVDGAVIFPHNIGLGCMRNTELVDKAAGVTAEEIAGTGMHWTFAPCVAVARDIRWGRTYESFGEDPTLVAELGAASVLGLQGGDLSDGDAVLSCTKHFVGDGGTTNGIDQGNTEIDEETLRKIHLPGYISAIKENTGSIMASYSSWNSEKLHGNKYLITDLLKGELGFEGFVVSDWAAIDQLEGDYKSDIEKSINAGLDMIMIPHGPSAQGKIGDNGQVQNTYLDFITYLKELVNEGKVSQPRIDDAVRRILTSKFNLDLFNKTKTDINLTAKVGSTEHREIARKCVQQSLVLLKNGNKTLPISKDIKNIVVAGRGANDLGMQCGGWTISWQGSHGEIIKGGTTILTAIKNTVSKNTNVTNSLDENSMKNSDLIIIVVGEDPYAEGVGDRKDLNLSIEDLNMIKKAKNSSKPIVVILLSGRPMLLNNILEDCNAVVAAWLPGTEGQGIADVLFGDFSFTGKLSQTWPKSMDQIPINVGDVEYNPLFPFGYGLSY
ncbi:MAG: glycoside hydrolase family 3 C-terminal domain-containing protein [Ignavibacteriales bacterium]|nr:glycoside hydrolase family 3 C-terminal domain-containing protein [Ignavibacteriales bacterium]